MGSELSTAQRAGEEKKKKNKVTGRMQEGKRRGGGCTIRFRPNETQSSLGSAKGPEEIRGETVVGYEHLVG
jgi:hypothetical protein